MAELRLKAKACAGCFIIPGDFNQNTINLFAARANGLISRGSDMILVPSKRMGLGQAKAFAQAVKRILSKWDSEPFPTAD